MSNDWKKRLGVVYSTNPDFNYDNGETRDLEKIPPGEQDLRVMIDRKGRKGKTVTIIKGYRGSPDDLEEIARMLKRRCGTGGTVKEGEIIIQGDFCTPVINYLKNESYRVKKAGG